MISSAMISCKVYIVMENECEWVASKYTKSRIVNENHVGEETNCDRLFVPVNRQDGENRNSMVHSM